VWFALSFQGIRQAPLFAITAAVAIADLWPQTLWHWLLVKYGDGSLARESRPAGDGGKWWVIPAAAAVSALAFQVAELRIPLIGHGWARLDPAFVPVDLNDTVRQHLARPGIRVFNDANLGGYLIYHVPKAKVFMDDRCELYGDDWLRSYSDAMGLPPDELGPVFEGWAAGFHFDHAFVMTNPPEKEKPSIERYLLDHPEKWREVARGKRAVLFERVR
jgi:hypothetical protein